METVKTIRCPICGAEHEVYYYDYYDGRLGPGTGFYAIKCKKYESPIEISCFSIDTLMKACEEDDK